MRQMFIYKHKNGKVSFCWSEKESDADYMVQETEYPNIEVDELEDYMISFDNTYFESINEIHTLDGWKADKLLEALNNTNLIETLVSLL